MVCWELEKQQRMKVAIENRQSMGFILSWYEAPGIREEQPRGDLTQLGSGERVLLPTGREREREPQADRSLVWEVERPGGRHLQGLRGGRDDRLHRYSE